MATATTEEKKHGIAPTNLREEKCDARLREILGDHTFEHLSPLAVHLMRLDAFDAAPRRVWAERREPFTPIDLSVDESRFIGTWGFGASPCDMRDAGGLNKVEWAAALKLARAGYLYYLAEQIWPERWAWPDDKAAPPGPPRIQPLLCPTPEAYRHLEWGFRFVGELPVGEAYDKAVAQFPAPLVQEQIGQFRDEKSVARFVPASRAVPETKSGRTDAFTRGRLVLVEEKSRYKKCDGFIIDDKHTRVHWGHTLPEDYGK